VKALQADGHRIEAVTHKGYCLSPDSDILTAQSILCQLSEDASRFSVTVRDSMPSTNTYLKGQAGHGAPEGAVIVAREQTGGRGRQGRSFFSPSGTGVYFSLLLRPKLKAEEATLVTSAAAVAVSEALEAVAGVQTQIKWVNDVYIAGKKVCGILTEGAFDMESGGMDYIVLGIGINLTPPEGGFPEDIRQRAASVFGVSGTPAGMKSRIIAEVLRRFMRYYDKLADKEYLARYRDRLFILGMEVSVINGEETWHARAVSLDDDFRLLVRYDSGETAALSSGEVRVIPLEADT
jgi:BirA family biotin operon repressor/biotin-[acetyl-CoA-carboxylase] ligase